MAIANSRQSTTSNHLLELQKEIKEEEEEIFADINSLINDRSHLCSSPDFEDPPGHLHFRSHQVQNSFKSPPHVKYSHNQIEQQKCQSQHQPLQFHQQTQQFFGHQHRGELSSSADLYDQDKYYDDEYCFNNFKNTSHLKYHQIEQQKYRHQPQDEHEDEEEEDDYEQEEQEQQQQQQLQQEQQPQHQHQHQQFFGHHHEEELSSTADLSERDIHYPDEYCFNNFNNSDDPELQAIIKKVTSNLPKPCVFFLEGNCRRSDCRYSHDLSKIICKYWIEGFCFKGEMCPFLHSYNVPDSSLSDEDQSDDSLTNKQQLNPTFVIESEVDFPSLAGE